jgi:hypothetical protein
MRTELHRARRPWWRAGLCPGTVLLVLALLGLPAGWPLADEAPVILIREASSLGSLAVAPADALELDLSDFRFQDPKPDTIVLHIQDFGRSDYYALSYDPKITRYRLDHRTLRPKAGATPFEGLPAGGYAFLLFGREPWPGSLDSGTFAADLSIQLRIQEQEAP